MRVVAAQRRSKTMKRTKTGKLVLSKETLRALTQGQLSEANGGKPWTTSLDPMCYYTDSSCATSFANCCD